jgi:hypothetical protein
MRDDDIERYDEKWHRRVDRTLFGHVDDTTGIWVDGLLQSLADSRKIEQLAVRVGLPLLTIIAVGVLLTAMHAPPTAINAILRLIGWH